MNSEPVIKETEEQTLRARIGPLLLLTIIFFLNFNARIVFAPLLPEIEADLNISHAAAGSFFLFLSAGYFITLLGSGWVAARLPHRQTIVFSSVAIGCVLIVSTFSNGLWAIRISLFFVGCAGGLYLPSGIATLTSLIDSRHWGKATAVHELAPNLAFVAAPVFAELVLMQFSWRTAPLLVGAAAVIAGIGFARYGRGGDFVGAAPDSEAVKLFLVKPAFWIMVLLFGLGISSTLGVYTMLPLYLVNELGISRNFTNALVAVSRVSGLFMAFVSGWATDRFGPAKTMTVVFLLTGILTVVMGAVSGKLVLTAVFLQPVLAVCFFPAGFAVLSKIAPPNARNIAVALTAPTAFLLGGGLVPSFIGFFGDTYSFGTGFVLIGVLITCGAVPAFWLGRR